MTVVSMSHAELDRVQVLRDVVAERISVGDAAQLLHLTRRHVFRLLQVYRRRGPAGLVSQSVASRAIDPIQLSCGRRLWR